MKKKENGRKKIGRPRKTFDFRQFEELCKILCTQDEICSVLGVTDKTLNARLKAKYGVTFSAIYKKFSAVGKTSLRRAQFRLAENNATMAIWLGKQHLGQRDDAAAAHDLELWQNEELEILPPEKQNVSLKELERFLLK